MKFQHTEKLSGVRGWQQAVSAAYFPLVTEGRNQGDFHGSLDIWNLGAVSATRITCDAVLYRRDASHLREEQESSLLISIPSRAIVTFRQNNRQAICPPGGFVIERSDAPYEYWHEKPDVQWVVKVPRDAVLARIGRAERTLELSVDARSGLASYFLSSLRAAVTHASNLTEQGKAAAGAHLLEILGLALRGDARALGSGQRAIRQAHLHRAEAFIYDHLKDPDLKPEVIAAACGISVRYLQQLFAEAGRTMSTFIRESRLTRCDEDLRHGIGAETIASIAYRWGFADQAQFSRLYRARYGLSPRKARMAHARPAD
jgi:AraC-like DNA-binding protein